MFTSKGRCISMLVTWIVTAAVAMPAMAQGTELEEIVVTARKRDEALLDVPVVVSAFGTAGDRSRQASCGRRTSSP